MNVECFLDTNVIVYAAAGRGRDTVKRERALELIETCDFAISAQVLQEFYVTDTRKIEIPLSPAEALEWLEQLEMFSLPPSRAGNHQDCCRDRPAISDHLLGCRNHCRRGSPWSTGRLQRGP